MSQPDAVDSSQSSQNTSSSQDSGYGSSTEIKPASQEIEHAANWLARQLLDSIIESPLELEEGETNFEAKWESRKVIAHTLVVKKPQELVVVQGKTNDEILKKRASRRPEPATTAQGPQVDGAVTTGEPQQVGGDCQYCDDDPCSCGRYNKCKKDGDYRGSGCRE